MTARLTRRGAIALLGVGALGGLTLPAARARASGAARLSPPPGPMLFSRRVLREMVGGASIVAERGFEVRFQPLAQGFRVEGAQVSSAVEAPPELAQLAQIERKRIEASLFPLELDRDGLMLAETGPKSHRVPGLDEAVDLALASLRETGATEATLTDANAFFLWLQQAAGAIGSEAPRKLFVPPAEAEQVTRVVQLPGGASGTIETRFWGTVSPATGLMRQAEREIVTRTGESGRRTVETWSLAEA